MGIMLYRPGKTHIEHGVECEMQKFRTNDYPAILDQGWFTDPREMGDTVSLEEELLDEINEDGTVEELTDEEIRARAKELGIRNWHNKKIETLKKEIAEG